MKLELSTQRVEDAVVVFNSVISVLTSAVLFWVAASLLGEAQTSTSAGAGLTLGTFLAFNTAFGNFSQGTTELSNTLTETLQVIPQWKRTQSILQTLPEVNLRKTHPGKLIGKIVIDIATAKAVAISSVGNLHSDFALRLHVASVTLRDLATVGVTVPLCSRSVP